MMRHSNTPTVMFWNCLGIASAIFSLGASWSISQAKIYELEAVQYKLQVGSALDQVQKVSDDLSKSAECLPIAAKTKADLQQRLNENNAVIESAQDEINQTIGDSI
jgi:hypothetical protein